jgi:hypothetical protein
MKLLAADPRIQLLALQVAQSAVGIADLAAVELLVEVVVDFSDLSSEMLKQTPARYEDASRRILINQSTFFTYRAETWPGILAHEVGEYVALHHRRLVKEVRALNRDLQADYVACVLGFVDSLSLGRSDRGETYHTGIRAWKTPEVFADQLTRWRNAKIAGISK